MNGERGRREVTNVGNVELTASATRTSTHAGVEAAGAAVSTTAHAASESATAGSARRAEPGLSLAILNRGQYNGFIDASAN